MDTNSFWSELRRRRVVRLAIIYAVVGWVVIEAADVIFPALLLPEWAPRLIVAVVILGFPIALLLSWMFELTGGGVKRTRRDADDGGEHFTALGKAYADRSAGLIYLHVDPSYDPLRGDPRYDELVKRIGLRGEGRA